MMLHGAMIVWFIPTGASVAFFVWDPLTNGVTSWVQRLAWILVTVYTGPIGAFSTCWPAGVRFRAATTATPPRPGSRA